MPGTTSISNACQIFAAHYINPGALRHKPFKISAEEEGRPYPAIHANSGVLRAHAPSHALIGFHHRTISELRAAAPRLIKIDKSIHLGEGALNRERTPGSWRLTEMHMLKETRGLSWEEQLKIFFARNSVRKPPHYEPLSACEAVYFLLAFYVTRHTRLLPSRYTRTTSAVDGGAEYLIVGDFDRDGIKVSRAPRQTASPKIGLLGQSALAEWGSSH